MAIDTTDADGRAEASVRLGRASGATYVRVRAPELGVVDSAIFTVNPGVAVGVRTAIKDTLISIGTAISIPASVVDRYGNVRSEAPALTAGPDNAFALEVKSDSHALDSTRRHYLFAMPIFGGFRWLVFGAICACTAGNLSAQASTQLPLDDAAYAALDRIVGSGLVQTVFYGQRPYTRVEVARIVQEANANLANHSVSPSTRRLLAGLAVRFARELQAASQAPSSNNTGATTQTNTAATTQTNTDATTQRATTVRTDARVADVELLLLNSPTRAIESAPTGGIAADV
ncbi:MAG: hypothetical protein M3Y64_11975, partial [Gemmatimonadota bacterium]|nr:hypothetical protein [Gemmatimonadota bacterium]